MEYILAHADYLLPHADGVTPLLTFIIFLPLLGALATLVIPKTEVRLMKAVAVFSTVATFLLSLVALSNFDGSTHKMQLAEYHTWIPSIGVAYFLGIDGLSILLVLLTTLLSILVVVCSFNAIHDMQKAYYSCLLFLETGMLGVFPGAGFLPVLHLLGDHAGADVLPDRHLGARTAAVFGDQVLPLSRCSARCSCCWASWRSTSSTAPATTAPAS